MEREGREGVLYRSPTITLSYRQAVSSEWIRKHSLEIEYA